MADPRRRVICPVSECEYTGRIDNAKAHLRSLIVWSNRYEGEAAEQDETSYSMASKESKKHTSWFRRYGFTETKWPQFQSDSEKMKFKSISTFFGNSSTNNNNQRGDEATPVLAPGNPICVCASTDHVCQSIAKNELSAPWCVSFTMLIALCSMLKNFCLDAMSAAPDNMLAAPCEIKGRINSIQERISTVRIIYTSVRDLIYLDD